jgi:hypothetical protein
MLKLLYISFPAQILVVQTKAIDNIGCGRSAGVRNETHFGAVSGFKALKK